MSFCISRHEQRPVICSSLERCALPCAVYIRWAHVWHPDHCKRAGEMSCFQFRWKSVWRLKYKVKSDINNGRISSQFCFISYTIFNVILNRIKSRKKTLFWNLGQCFFFSILIFICSIFSSVDNFSRRILKKQQKNRTETFIFGWVKFFCCIFFIMCVYVCCVVACECVCAECAWKCVTSINALLVSLIECNMMNSTHSFWWIRYFSSPFRVYKYLWAADSTPILRRRCITRTSYDSFIVKMWRDSVVRCFRRTTFTCSTHLIGSNMYEGVGCHTISASL